MLKNLQRIYNTETLFFGAVVLAFLYIAWLLLTMAPAVILIIILVGLIAGPIGKAFIKIAESNERQTD